MACSSCKKKESFNEKYKEATSYVGRTTIIFTIVWSLLALYGIYSLIIKLI